MTRALALALTFSLPLAARADEVAPQSAKSVRFFPAAGTDAIARELAATADRDRAMVSRDLGRDYEGVTDVYLAGDAATFRALEPADTNVPSWAAGVAFPERNLIILRVTASEAPRAILRHELSHIAVGRLTRGEVPHWFLEGLATLRQGDAWSREGPSLIRAGLSNNFLSMDSLTNSFPARPSDAELAYAESASFVQYLSDRYGATSLQEVLRQVVAGSSFDDALLRVTGASARNLENRWRRSLDKWVLAIDFLTSRELFWMSATMLMLLAGFRARSRRRARIVQLGIEERDETARALLEAPAIWADSPEPQAPEAVEETPMRGAATDEESEETPKKPTIH